jgi:alcohol dehydrogenase
VQLADARVGARPHAERLGLHALTRAELRRHPPAPLTVAVSGSPSGLRAALSATAPDGICSSAGGLHRSARIPTGRLYGRNVTYHVGRTHARAVIPAVLELMRDGRLRPNRSQRAWDRSTTPRLLREHIQADATKTILTDPQAPANPS